VATTYNVGANGNILTGGLSFSPTKQRVAVGDTVVWTNTDFLVPHTATEDHGLWDLGGSYGATPFNPAGFGPRASVSRPFEAGAQAYYCRVHPTQMKAEIDVPVTLGLSVSKLRVRVKVKLKRKRGHKQRYRYKRVTRKVEFVDARWAPKDLTGGEVMDVQSRTGVGDWQPVASATTAASGRFKAGRKGTRWEVRARLRRASDGKATGWSPISVITG
jgi:plastocyanin